MKAKAAPSKLKAKSASFTVKAGSVEVPVYGYQRTVNGAVYATFEVVHYLPLDGGGRKRVRRLFSNEKDARNEAQVVAARLSRGEVAAASATGDDMSAYGAAVEQLRPFGKQLSLAVGEYIEALKLLPPGRTLKDAVSDAVHRWGSVRAEISVPALVDEYLAAKAKAGLSGRHLKDITARLGRFARHFQTTASGLTAPMIEKFLDGLGVSNRSRINEITTLASMLRYAVKLRYVPREFLDELAAIQRPKAEPPKTEIWQPGEYREMLESSPPEYVPFLVLAGFCGMRSSEVTRADWGQLTPDRKFFAVITRKGRTPARRLVPVCPSALAWLTPHIKESGPICHTDREVRIIEKIKRSVDAERDARGVRARFQWRLNALRHSYGTYRVALSGDIARTALEMGNSSKMITQHYLQLARKEEAEAFFGILPSAP